jgi:FkbM family methyltransferase
MSTIKRRIQTASNVYHSFGLSGLFTIFTEKIRAQIGKTKKWWLRNDHWLVGKLVELKGNWVEMDGGRFYVKSDYIPTRLKSRFLLDRYEKPERQALAYLDPSLPIIELGAGIGVISCLANKKMTQPERHIVVEPNPFLLPLLYKNRETNHCHFAVLNAAVGYGRNTTHLFLQPNFLDSSVSSSGGTEILLPTTSLTEIAEVCGLERIALICDIEGTEVDLVSQEGCFLEQNVDFVIFEIHETSGKTRNDQMIAELERLGFSLQWMSLKTFVGRKVNYSS